MGRDDELKALYEQLQQEATVAIISGMGGIGKTELALQYARKHCREESYLGGICWLQAREEVGTQIISFARSCLELIPPDDLELAEKVRWCWGRWREGMALLIFDDVQDYEDVRSFLPPQESHFKVLMTTRSRFGLPVQELQLDVLSEAKALELLRVIVQDQRVDQGLATAKQVCEWLGYLPLGLELVGRYLAKKKDVSISELWKRLQAKKLSAKALLEAELGMTASLGVASAFELSWQDLDQKSKQLAALLSLFALAEIPWELVKSCLPEQEPEDLEDRRDEKLLGLSLLTRVDEGMYQLHQLLREFFVAKISETERKVLKTVFATTMIRVAQQIPQDPTLEEIQAVTAAIPHLKEVAADLLKLEVKNDLYIQEDNNLNTVFVGISWFYEGQGLYAEAAPWYKDGLTVVRLLLGEEHPDVGKILNYLALLYKFQGRYSEAEPLYQQALALRRHLLGEKHPDVANTLNNLAGLYRLQERYSEAEPLYQQALALRQHCWGEKHSDVAESLNNLALLYWGQERYSEAEPLYQQALTIYRDLLGEKHAFVATVLNNLALLHRSQGRYNDAEQVFLQAIFVLQDQIGVDHPNVARFLSNLACLYNLRGRYCEAETLYLQALPILSANLEETHIWRQEASKEFRSLLQKAIQENCTDELSDHPMTRSLLQQLQDASD